MKHSDYSKQQAKLCDIRHIVIFGSLSGVVSLISFLMENVGLKQVIADMFMTDFPVMWIRTQI